MATYFHSPIGQLIKSGPFIEAPHRSFPKRYVMLFKKRDDYDGAIYGALAGQEVKTQTGSWEDIEFQYDQEAVRCQLPSALDPRVLDDRDLYMLLQRFAKDLGSLYFHAIGAAFLTRDAKPGQFGFIDNPGLYTLADADASVYLNNLIGKAR